MKNTKAHRQANAEELLEAQLSQLRANAPLKTYLQNFALDLDLVYESFQQLRSENARLRSGNFTEGELQNLCHELGRSEKHDDRQAFFDGCARYQKQLFGEADREQYQRQLHEAAREINCAGPLAHRIRILKKEHHERVVELRQQIAQLREQLRTNGGSKLDRRV